MTAETLACRSVCGRLHRRTQLRTVSERAGADSTRKQSVLNPAVSLLKQNTIKMGRGETEKILPGIEHLPILMKTCKVSVFVLGSLT